MPPPPSPRGTSLTPARVCLCCARGVPQYYGGGTASDRSIEPRHDPNDGGPRQLGVRPAYGLFLRQLHDARFEGLTLSFLNDDERPALVLLECANVSLLGAISLQRGPHCDYDIGVRNSSGLHVADPRVRVRQL